MKIYAPVKDFNGLRNNVRFVDGLGETDNPQAIEWFKSNGYKVPNDEPCVKIESNLIETHSDESEFVEINKVVEDEPNFDKMNPNELRDWMREHGYGPKIKNTRNKEKLLEILRG